MRKVTIFLKNHGRGFIVLTDESDTPVEEIVRNFSSIMSDTEVGIFATSNDIIILHPSEISAIQIKNEDKTANAEYDKKTYTISDRKQYSVDPLEFDEDLETGDYLDIDLLGEDKPRENKPKNESHPAKKTEPVAKNQEPKEPAGNSYDSSEFEYELDYSHIRNG